MKPEILILLGAVLAGIGVPWLVTRMLMTSLLEDPSKVVMNYRGARVRYGLGVAWLVWSLCALVAAWAASALSPSPLWGLLAAGGVVAAFSFTAGVVDDAYGSGASRGFRGHLRQLTRGRLSTGGLKIVVVGTVSLGAAIWLAPIAVWGTESASAFENAGSLVRVLLAGASIAFTANLVNLLDLRPGRALKSHVILSFGGVAGAVAMIGTAELRTALITGAVAVIMLLGPVVAMWRYDLGEQAMLGDAGANAMGAVSGVFIVSGLSLGWLVAYALFVFGLNLISERVSFSRVIEANTVLRRLDEFGRKHQ